MKKEKKNKKLKFVIASPHPLGGGPIVLHSLCKNLCKFGIDAKIIYFSDCDYASSPFKFWWCYLVDMLRFSVKKFLANILGGINSKWRLLKITYKRLYTCKIKYLPIIRKNTIVVYPEIMKGDPFRAKNKVIYLLSCPMGLIETIDNTLVMYYREIFAEGLNLPPENKLYTSYFDLELYKRTNFGERKGKCYIIRKGRHRTDLPKEFDGVVVDNLIEEEKVRVFNECEYCISYDTQTAYSGIAAMCGCVSVVVPEEGKGRKDYLKGNEKGYGVAYGFSEKEIEWAKSTRDKRQALYEKLNADSLEQTKNFVELCKKKFNL